MTERRDAIALAGLLPEANVQAFLALIRAGEGTTDADGYRRHFGGRLFDSFADHPRVAITAGLGRNQYTSTAAGAYQFLARTWDILVAQYGFADFEPRTQDIAALALIDGRRALEDVRVGRIVEAIRKCAREWASLPGSPYGQPTRSLEQALATYTAAGGALAPAADTTPPIAQENPATAAQARAAAPSVKDTSMPLPAILAAVLPSIVAAIPTLGKLFGSGSEVAERNVKAAEIAVDIVKEAVGAKNAQEAAEVIAADPAAAQTAREAIAARWLELTEVGGGIEAARKADAAYAAAPWHAFMHSPSFWIALALLPLVYMIVANIVGLVGKPLSDEVRSAIANGVVGMVLGGLVGYYYGQSTSRNRTQS